MMAKFGIFQQKIFLFKRMGKKLSKTLGSTFFICHIQKDVYIWNRGSLRKLQIFHPLYLSEFLTKRINIFFAAPSNRNKLLENVEPDRKTLFFGLGTLEIKFPMYSKYVFPYVEFLESVHNVKEAAKDNLTEKNRNRRVSAGVILRKR